MSLCDSFGRELSYLRLSLISKCNLNCWYCRPYEKSQEGDQSFPLNISEIKNLAKALGPLGIKKIRLTGGEPTLRNDLAKIIQALAETNYFEKIALSTNGLRLKTLARPLQSAGLHALNISVDSLDPQQYYQITGADRLSDVLEGIDASLQTGIKTIKINAVLMKGINSESLSSFLALIKKAPLSVRFIEFMKTENNSSLFTRLHLSRCLRHPWPWCF
ncbi:MAG: radical SAM protein, partial [Pseudomonadota bacterium]